MFYVIQMIDSGIISPPQIFNSQDKARTAFSNLVREHAGETFSRYCAVNGLEAESFAAARAFAMEDTRLDVSFSYWELASETNGTNGESLAPAGVGRESALKVAAETQQQVLGVQSELRILGEKLTAMSQELIRFQNLFGEDRAVAVLDATIGPEETSPPDEPGLAEKYQTSDWQAFVQSLIQMCGGNWGEFPLLSRQDWRQAVYSNQSSLPYWDWAAISIDRAIEKARTSGYAVEEDDAQFGYYYYRTPAGERSSTLHELEDLAWCEAGLHAFRREDEDQP